MKKINQYIQEKFIITKDTMNIDSIVDRILKFLWIPRYENLNKIKECIKIWVTNNHISDFIICMEEEVLNRLYKEINILSNPKLIQQIDTSKETLDICEKYDKEADLIYDNDISLYEHNQMLSEGGWFGNIYILKK